MDGKVYLAAAELASRWHTTEANLNTMRANRTGPRFYKNGRRVLYKITEVEAYETEQFHTVEPQVA